MTGRVIAAAFPLALLGGCSSASTPSGNVTAVNAEVSGSSPSATTSSGTSCSWTKVRSPNSAPSRFYEQLRRIAVASPNDAWALGLAYVDQEGGAERPVLLHWDGRSWRRRTDALGRVGVPDISASSPSNVWAVGSQGNHGIGERWDGSSWTISRLAEPARKGWVLDGVVALSPSDVWAVGYMHLGERNSDGFGALIEHWDGTEWSITPTPPPHPSIPGDIAYARLYSVAASGPNDVWAVGEASYQYGPSAVSDTLVEHWDGARWSVAPTPDVASPRGIPFDHLFSVAAVSPTDVWAVGSYGTADFFGGRGDHPLVLHWDGIRWTGASTPPQESAPLRWARLTGVAADGSGTVWAVGSAGSGTQRQPIATTWDGHRWTASTVHGPAGSTFNDVALSPSGGLPWAVGSMIRPGAPEQTLTARCSPS